MYSVPTILLVNASVVVKDAAAPTIIYKVFAFLVARAVYSADVKLTTLFTAAVVTKVSVSFLMSPTSPASTYDLTDVSAVIGIAPKFVVLTFVEET